MGLARDTPDWVVGFEDECWWSRLALPSFCIAGPKPANPCAWCSGRSPKTIPIPKPSPATGCFCPNSAGRGCVSWMAAP
jgi:hypothetical protein